MGYVDQDGDYQMETMEERYARYRREDQERAERTRQRLERYKQEDDARHNANLDFIETFLQVMFLAVLIGGAIIMYYVLK